MDEKFEIIDEITGLLAESKRMHVAFASLLDCCLENYGDLPAAVMHEVARCCDSVKAPLKIVDERTDINEYGDKPKRYDEHASLTTGERNR